MLKRSLSLLALLVCMIPMVAFAGSVTTRVMTIGGKITVGGVDQTSANGTVIKSYTAAVPVTITPNAGYVISAVNLTNATPGLVNSLTVPLLSTSQTLTVSFTKQLVNVTATATSTDGTVSPSGTQSLYAGTPATFSFIPNAGKKVVAITGLPAGAVLKDTAGAVVTLPFTGTVKATFTVPTSPLAITGSFVSLIANAGANQTVFAPTATLAGSANVVAGTTYAWTQVGGPVIAGGPTLSTDAAPTLTLPGAGTYVLKLTAKNGTDTAVSTVSVTVASSPAQAGLDQCGTCHAGSNVAPTVYPNWNKSSHANSTHETVMCYNCHVGADSGAHPGSVSMTDGKTDTCFACHKYYGPTANYSIYTDGTYATAKAPHGEGKAAPATGAAVVGDSITQYLTQGAICSDCHGHDNTINAGFAEGGHGKVSSEPMNPWTHYDWSARLNNGTRQNGNCDRCHTAVGFIKFAKQDPAMQTRLALQAGKPNNVLICVACHKSAEGELRTDAVPAGNGRALSAGYFALFSSSATAITTGNTKIEVAFPGYKNSSICVPCHSGRTTTAVWVETYAKSAATNKNYSTIQNSIYQHAKNMGQSFIGTGAYDFSGKLASIGVSAHGVVNMAGSQQGPCVGCHHSYTEKTHSLEVNAASADCLKCHASAPNLEEAKANFDAGVKALDTLIRAKMAPLNASGSTDLAGERAGYWRYSRLYRASNSTADKLAATTKGYGAWNNWQMLTLWDNAAWAHNPAYARQVLNDTIDYLDNGILDNTAAATIAATAGLTPAEATAAGHFLTGSAGTGCIDCHSVARDAGAGYVQDNNGVRAITAEFSKWSHHVTGVQLQDAHCAACHLEGKVVNGSVVVDATKHMADAKTHLRNADTDADMQWDPAAPNHSVMDNFCMSCHDANGATSAASAAIQAVIVPAAGKVASAKNPFGDTISNRYDKMQRPGVVDVDSQFNTSNNSHHAVKGPRYTGRTRAAGPRQIASPTTFANNSSAILKGKRSTMFDAGVLNQLYVPLEDAAGEVAPRTGSDTLGDDSTLHCGDCHTVGQWKAGVATNNLGVLNTVAIGAHGSNNEYMLRNNIGTDARHYQNTYTVTAGIVTNTNAGGAFLVCYNCHAFSQYGSVFNATGVGQTGGATGPHVGEYDQAGRCDGAGNTLPFNGYTTGTATDGTQFASRFEGPISKYGTTPAFAPGFPLVGTTGTEQNPDFGNIFGIQCQNCHNSGLGNAYGGIHGSANNTHTTTKTTDPSVTGGAYIDGMGNTTKVERFLPGLGDAMHVPGTLGGFTGGTTTGTPAYVTGGISNDTNWEQKHWQQTASTHFGPAGVGPVSGTLTSAGAGCYTLGTGAAASALEGPSVTGENGPATEGFETWGGCDDHNAAQGKGDHGFIKRIVRPVTY